MVILIFIFLTPKSWFASSERPLNIVHQSPVASTVLVGAELIDNVEDKARVEQVIRTIADRPNAEVLTVRKVVGTDGKIRAYEVDIR